VAPFVNLAIIGGGSWGTALAVVLAPKFKEVRLWMHEADLAQRVTLSRQNDVFLPGITLPETVRITTVLGDSVRQAQIVLGVMPSHFAREIYQAIAPELHPDMIFVSATKGIERGSLLRMSQVLEQTLEPMFNPRVAALSGPTFAKEVACGEPAAVVVASKIEAVAARVQALFSGPTFRLYTNSDPVGVEVAAALKNVIAIAAGVCQGLGLGSNTHAALITRGLAEITRLAVAMGGQPRTLSGLAGLGDLVLTCSGDLSRNRTVGKELASGKSLAEIVGSMKMIAEGVETCDAAVALGQKFQVDLPITNQMYAVLHNSKSPREAVRELMDRSLKPE
jgi:glycerol-3-phosphate dehydrogenase (NAD(P)+)